MRPAILNPLFALTSSLKGVGPRTEEALKRAMGPRLKDLLLTRPTSLTDRSNRPTLSGARKDEIGTFMVTVGQHTPGSSKSRPYRIRVFDDTDDMTLVFFQARKPYLESLLPTGSKRLISGKVDVYQTQLQMTHPDYVLAPKDANELPLYETHYPLTEGLSQKVARKAIIQSLSAIPELDEWLDPALMQDHGWLDFAAALRRLHSPEHPADILHSAPPSQRLAYDELLAQQLALALVRDRARKSKGRAYKVSGEYVSDVLRGAPFEPTGAQTRTFEEIKSDLEAPERMTRLLQGDVGAGKTFVAALAAAHVCEARAQVAVMAPTEILARQHLKTLSEHLEPAGLVVKALTGRDVGKPRESILSGLSMGHIDVIVGTHALFQDKVEFHDLGLVIIDEQHRFGVQDRMKLTQKGADVDYLIMTATPIPRTLELSQYSDLDVSRLDEKPKGRIPISTRILPVERLDNVIEGIGRALAKGEQVYWVCPLVEDSEISALTSVEHRYKVLNAEFPGKVALVHGRLSAKEKNAVSEAFKRGEFAVLVATTVIEVGVDAPNATIIVIEHAERFGLAQLHQLRGRVGRSDKPSTCLLMYKGPLSVNGKARLEILRASNDGFEIAEKDWELRGSGDLLGDRQSGLPQYHFVDLDKHKDLLETAYQDARYLVQMDPSLESRRAKAAINLLYLFEQEYGVKLMKVG